MLLRLRRVLGSPKYHPPPFRLQQRVRRTIATPSRKLMSFHCRARYSSGRMPVARAIVNTMPHRSRSHALIKRAASSGDSARISFLACFGSSTRATAPYTLFPSPDSKPVGLSDIDAIRGVRDSGSLMKSDKGLQRNSVGFRLV
jgi:hypothetical protein